MACPPVSAVVKETPGAIGYIELAYANQNGLPVALVRNKAGNWIAPSAPSTTAAMQAYMSAHPLLTLLLPPKPRIRSQGLPF
jgi:phosphate transport system substrate-binding protein